jgi:hypothetical protein
MSLINIDLTQSWITPQLANALRGLIDKQEQYHHQGRDHEATSMAKAFRIVKRAFQPGDFEDTKPTGWSSL